MDTLGPSDFLWEDHPIANRVIIQALQLKDALTELEWWGNVLELVMSPNAPYMQMTSKGDHGSLSIAFPSDCESIDEFQCKETRKEGYKMSWMQCMFKALGLSDKACMRMNSNGMLSVQLMIRDDSPVTTFVEFLMCSNSGDDQDS